MMKPQSEQAIKIIRTSVLYLTSLAIGLCAAIPGPTLLDLQQIVHANPGKIAFLYLSRSASALVGSIVGGIIFDLTKRKQLFIAFCNLCFAITALATPWCQNVIILISIWAIYGLAMGAANTGTNVLCLNIWGKESPPYFQALHFLYGIGGFIAPLIAEPFLSKQCKRTINETSLLHFNKSTLVEMSLQNHTDLKETYLPCVSASIPSVVYAYTIVGGFCILGTISYFIVSIMYPKEESIDECKSSDKKCKNDLGYAITVGVLSLFLMTFVCGAEIGYAQMLTSFGVRGNLKLSKSTASFMTAFYWGTFTAGRGLGVYLSCKFSPFTLVVGDLVAILFSSSLLVAYGSVHVEVLWVGTFFLGGGVASFFPSAMTWVEIYIYLNSKLASLFVVAAMLGEMTIPFIVSMYAQSEPNMLMYVMMACGIGATVVTFLLWFVMTKKGPKE